MLGKRKVGLFLVTLLVLAMAMAACQAQPVETIVEVTRVVTETQVVEGEPIEVTRVVTETETVTEVVEVTAVPEAGEADMVPMTSADPSTYVRLTFGDITTMDPAMSYDTAGSTLIEHVYEGLVTYNHKDGTSFVPALALEVPSVENGLISEDGLTYTFNIREGINFHEGGTLEPHDVAYTFQRGLLQSDPSSAQLLWLEPILGYTSGDVTEEIQDGAYAGDRDGLIANATPEELLAVCEKVKAAVVADDDAGTVTFNLAQSWSPFIQTMGHSSGFILDQEWAIEQGAWDGDCNTWQDYYAIGSENDPLTPIANGTGPFKLEYWTPGEEYSLVRNDDYWRTEETPLWEGGPYGPAALERVVVRIVDEWGTRFASLQAGDADSVAVPKQNEPQVDPFVAELCNWETDECTPTGNEGAYLRKWNDFPTVRSDIALWNYEINPDSPYLGSGQLDGNGITPDFFADENVRKAMNYCFDYDTYIDEVLNGGGIRVNGPIITGMLGYNENGPQYEYDPEQCATYLEQAWGGVLPETGFRFQYAYNTGNLSRQTVGAILQAELSAINPNYVVEVVALPWPSYLKSLNAKMLPAQVGGWVEDIHDPHNWVQPYLWGYYAAVLPEDLQQEFLEMGTAAVKAPTDEEREQLYFEIQQKYFDEAVQMPLAQSINNFYEQLWDQGYYHRIGKSYPMNFYAISKE
jgi:peptide/nickel transport system substrate-binding protein